MKLAQWLKSRSITQQEFAVMLGVSKTTVSNIICGHRWLGRDLAQKIAQLTSGEVTANDFVWLDPERDAA